MAPGSNYLSVFFLVFVPQIKNINKNVQRNIGKKYENEKSLKFYYVEVGECDNRTFLFKPICNTNENMLNFYKKIIFLFCVTNKLDCR